MDPPDPASRSDGPSFRLEGRVLRLLRSAFQGAGWELPARPGGGAQADLLVREGGRAYAVEVKASRGRARRTVLRGLLADAILQSRAAARELDAEPLAIVAASALSDEIAEELREYVERFGEGAAWGLLDERGRFELHGPGLEGVRPPKQRALFRHVPSPAAPAQNPFSDLGQWMLKVLLAPRVPEGWLRAPRVEIRGMAELASRAYVSAASASRFLAAMEAHGYLARVDGVLRVVRVGALLSAWRMASMPRVERCFARFLLPADDVLARAREALAARHGQMELFDEPSDAAVAERIGRKGQRACLAYHAACRALGVGVVRGAPVHLYCEDLSPDSLRQLELQPVQHRSEADLIVVRPRFPESVFRGCVPAEGVPAADVLQCWLDVSFEAARGEEQADEIAQRLGFEDWEE